MHRFLNSFCLSIDPSDEEIQMASTFRARCRLPVISWCDSGIEVTVHFIVCILASGGRLCKSKINGVLWITINQTFNLC